jgi:phospholipid/cholesterol/gamma-HCH transport system permease protein
VVVKFIDSIGKCFLSLCYGLGDVGVFLYTALETFFTTKLKVRKVFYYMNYIGVTSIGIILLVGVTVGAVLALQSYVGLERFGGSQFVGPIIFISMARELGPAFTAIMVTGRAGSAITAEIGTMRITEQIDALQTLCINVHQYLIVPRIVAGTIVMPFLSIFCTLFGVVSGYVVSVYILKINPEIYMEAIRSNVEMSDITHGLIKAVVFGFLVSLVSTYKGFITRGGAKGVGIATTQSVVYANISIFVANYILTSLMFSK